MKEKYREMWELTVGDVKALELDGLRVVDHCRQVGVNTGRATLVLIAVHQRRFLLSRQTPLNRTQHFISFILL